MALSVVKRPITFRYDEASSGTAAAFTHNSATLTDVAHGLSTGNYVYLSDGQHIGFWYVNKLTNDTFEIREYATATSKTFYGAGNVTWIRAYSGDYHFNAVHHPIVYKLSSDLWPTNSVDTARTVSSYANDLGYVKLTLSGDIKSDVTELEFIKITFTGGITEVYQILTWYSNSIVTINLPYRAGITFVAVQYYYTDYHARVKIYAGLESSHTLTATNPYVELAEIKVVPDSSGVMTVNINEILKSRIEILTNELNTVKSGSFYNDVSQFCQFYITYAEGYSYSAGGYTLLDYVGSYTDDSSNGDFYAVNSALAFKNVYSGMMSLYAYESTASIKQKFLTGFRTPVISAYTSRTLGQVSQFFDIGFIRNLPNATSMRVRVEFVRGGQIVGQTIDTLPSYDVGVYRYEIDRSAYEEDYIYVTVEADLTGFRAISDTLVIEVNDDCGPTDEVVDISWKNHLGVMDYWRFKTLSEYGIDIESSTEASKNYFSDWPNSWGAGADTIDFETSRKSRQSIVLRAENLSQEQAEDLAKLKTSPLVQIVNARNDRRTVIPDKGSFVYVKEGDRLFSLQFTIRFTDLLPSQSL